MAVTSLMRISAVSRLYPSSTALAIGIPFEATSASAIKARARDRRVQITRSRGKPDTRSAQDCWPFSNLLIISLTFTLRLDLLYQDLHRGFVQHPWASWLLRHHSMISLVSTRLPRLKRVRTIDCSPLFSGQRSPRISSVRKAWKQKVLETHPG